MDTGCFFLVVISMAFIFVFNRILRSLRINKSLHWMKYVLITGCDTGFGNITAKKLHQMGFNVLAACLSEKGRKELIEFAENENRINKMIPFLMNVACTESVKKGYTFVKEQIPSDNGLWGLVNNAGILGPVGGIEFFTRASYQQVLDVNALGMFDVTTQFLPLLKKAKGRIVNTASILGRVGLVNVAPYCVSKYAVEAFSDSARRQLKQWGVSVHIVEPGLFRTNFTDGRNTAENFKSTFYGADIKVVEEYGDAFLKETIEGSMKRSSNASENIHLVRDAYIHALTAVYPYVRYYVGADAYMVHIPLSFLPGAVHDKILSVLRKQPVPAALKK